MKPTILDILGKTCIKHGRVHACYSTLRTIIGKCYLPPILAIPPQFFLQFLIVLTSFSNMSQQASSASIIDKTFTERGALISFIKDHFRAQNIIVVLDKHSDNRKVTFKVEEQKGQPKGEVTI